MSQSGDFVMAGHELQPEDSPAPTAMPEVEPTEAPENDNDEDEQHVSAAAPPITSTQTFSLIGGTVTVTCTGNVISLDSATPNAGFTIDTERNEDGQV